MKKLLHSLLLLLLVNFSYSQCISVFTDNGGTTGDYLPNSTQTYTYCPTLPGGIVTVTFTEFNTEAQHDGLYVFNGSSSASSSIIPSSNGAGFVPGGLAGAFWGNTIPGPFTSSSPDGCLTFQFRSDGVNQNSGWNANVNICAVIISGFELYAFLDSNNNGNQDVDENVFPLGEFEYQKNGGNTTYFGYSNQGVVYVAEDNPANTYDFNYTLNSNYASFYTVANPTFSNVTIGSYPNLVTVNFPVTSLTNYNDLAVNCTSINQPKAGFTYTNRISFTNKGNTILDGSLSFVKDNALSTLVTSTIVNTNANGFTYDFTNLVPFETRYFDVFMQVPAIPTVSLGQLVTNSVTISTPATEIILTNNISTTSQAVVASYDPNDVTEAHGDKIGFSTFSPNDYLYYTIRFENTGTAEALNINVTDLLDAKIDESSIEMVASSHGYNLHRSQNNLSWIFKNINLPVSIANTNTGKGFITFKTKLKPGFALGDIIPNKANIYFDTNPAIETNTFTTEFVSTLANSTYQNANFSLSPIPVKEILNINSNTTTSISKISIYNSIGQLVLVTHLNNNQINVSTLKTGTYFIKMQTDNVVYNSKFIKE